MNGDGDKLDNIIRYYDISTGRVVNTEAETISTEPVISGSVIAFVSPEGQVGSLGTDLNGDGDKGDFVVRYYDISSGVIVNTGAEVSDFEVNISNNIIAFTAFENAIGRDGIDLTGDGDKSDRVIRYVIIGKEISTPPTASFTVLPTSGEAPLSVQFTDTSTNNPTSWSWDFDNNGTADSTVQNPSHTYTAPNTYTVSLTVANTAGSNTRTIPNFITVTAPDTTPPTVSITQPLDNAAVSGAVTIRAAASDDKGVNRVE